MKHLFAWISSLYFSLPVWMSHHKFKLTTAKLTYVFFLLNPFPVLYSLPQLTLSSSLPVVSWGLFLTSSSPVSKSCYFIFLLFDFCYVLFLTPLCRLLSLTSFSTITTSFQPPLVLCKMQQLKSAWLLMKLIVSFKQPLLPSVQVQASFPNSQY